MPTRPPTFKNRIHEAQKLEKEKQRQKDNSFYRSSEWKTLRKKHMMIEPFCRHCMHEGIIKEGTQVDHINPISVDPSGALDPSNLQNLCSHHHSKKTARENFFGTKKEY